ncbi:MAG: hypothetical protein ACI4CS_11985 [Candidatus Weimeria sp.]
MTEMKEISEFRSEVEKHLDDVLTDDNSDYGGTSYPGETLRDFIDSVYTKDYAELTMSDINMALSDCGIQTI